MPPNRGCTHDDTMMKVQGPWIHSQLQGGLSTPSTCPGCTSDVTLTFSAVCSFSLRSMSCTAAMVGTYSSWKPGEPSPMRYWSQMYSTVSMGRYAVSKDTGDGALCHTKTEAACLSTRMFESEMAAWDERVHVRTGVPEAKRTHRNTHTVIDRQTDRQTHTHTHTHTQRLSHCASCAPLRPQTH